MVRGVEIANGFCERFEIKKLGTSSAFESIKVNKQLSVPLLVEGEYSGMVKSITNLAETNFDNNVGLSNESVNVYVDELKLNEEIHTTIGFDSNRLFKFVPSYSLNAFRVILTTSFTSAFNDIFIGDSKQVPNENTFKARSKVPFSFNQTAVMRNVKPDVYYVLIKSFLSTFNQANGNYTIGIKVEEIKEIDVTLIYPSRISILGPSTFRFTGVFLAKEIQV